MYRPSSGRVGAGSRQPAVAHARPQPAAAQQQQQGGTIKRMSLSDFEKLQTIAKGSFGVVYKATRKDNGRVYALKQVEISNMNRAEREEAVDEVSSGCLLVPQPPFDRRETLVSKDADERFLLFFPHDFS